jgi:hypothetical protein
MYLQMVQRLFGLVIQLLVEIQRLVGVRQYLSMELEFIVKEMQLVGMGVGCRMRLLLDHQLCPLGDN